MISPRQRLFALLLPLVLIVDPCFAQAPIRSISAAGETISAVQPLQDHQPANVPVQAPPVAVGTVCAWPLDCTPRVATGRLNLDAYSAEITSTAFAFAIDPDFVRAIIHAESAFNPLARSHKGAQGLMQLMPQTASRFGVQDPWDPVQNIQGGVQYLAFLSQRFSGDETLMAAAFNAGEGAVDRHGGIPPYRETEAYVDKVLALARAYREAAMTRMIQPTVQANPAEVNDDRA